MSAPEVQHLIHLATTASLGTAPASGQPFVSLVGVAEFSSTRIVLLLSDLAKHAQHLAEHTRASLLISDDTATPETRLASPRVTLTGVVDRIPHENDEKFREAYLLKHPQAAAYASFTDFAIYVFQIEQAHLVAGFGQIRTLAAAELAQ